LITQETIYPVAGPPPMCKECRHPKPERKCTPQAGLSLYNNTIVKIDVSRRAILCRKILQQRLDGKC
jgi:hypothetical protein